MQSSFSNLREQTEVTRSTLAQHFVTVQPPENSVDGMGGFTISPKVFQCLSTKSKSRSRDSLRSKSSTNSSEYTPASSATKSNSVYSSATSLESASSTSSERMLLKSHEKRPRKKRINYNTSAFTGPTAFSKNAGYSPSELAALQPYRFSGRWSLWVRSEVLELNEELESCIVNSCVYYVSGLGDNLRVVGVDQVKAAIRSRFRHALVNRKSDIKQSQGIL